MEVEKFDRCLKFKDQDRRGEVKILSEIRKLIAFL